MVKTTSSKILIVDDNKSILTALKLLLGKKFAKVITLDKPFRIKELIQAEAVDVVLLDMNFKAGVNNGNEGLFWLKEIKKIAPEISIVMMTAYGDIQLAVNAIKEGATDFVVKPWENEKLIATINAAINLRESKLEVKGLKSKQNAIKKEFNASNVVVIGNSPVMQQVMGTVSKVANTDANILITGENGTGKELIAKEIHRLSSRSHELLVSVDMGAIPESLFESELFGHKRGAFTDAKEDRVGKFETADKGTLFLDEIGNLPLNMQAKLLAVLQTRKISRIGEDKQIPVDIRLISATNIELNDAVASKTFREDLLYRINTIQIEVPPLRERGDDIILIADFFLKKYCSKYGKRDLILSIEAKNCLKKYGWPGNVRELQHTMEKVVILSDKKILNQDDLYLDGKNGRININAPQTIDEMEKGMIEASIERHAGNLSSTAKQLGISRQTLYNKMRKFGL